MDEVYLSRSLLRMTYSELSNGVLDYQQKAPIGFLWLVKFSVNIFGPNELSLRFISFLSGLLSILLFERVCKIYLKPNAQIVAMCIFCLSPAIIYHSVEIKQYAMECLVTLFILYSYLKYENARKLMFKFIWGIIGGVLIWFSFPAIFILGGIGIGLSIYQVLTKNWQQFKLNLLPFSLWLISFLLNYILFTHKHAESHWAVYWFKAYDNFLPLFPKNLQQLKWFPRNFSNMMDYPLGVRWNLTNLSNNFLFKIISIPIIPALAFFTGIISIFRKDKKTFVTFIAAVLLMIVASGLYLYPLLERFWVFMAPIFILFIAFGFECLQDNIRKTAYISILGLILISGTTVQSMYFIIYPDKFYKHKKSYVKESLNFINNNFKDEDAVYIYWNNAPGYSVYKMIQNYRFNPIIGIDYRKKSRNLEEYNYNLQMDFNRFRNKKRVWVIYNSQFLTDIGDLVDDPKWYYKNKIPPNQNLISEFKKQGKIMRKLVYSDVTVYLLSLDNSN